MNFQNELFVLMEISITSSNETISETFKISIKMKLQWIRPLTNSDIYFLFVRKKSITHLLLMRLRINTQVDKD